MAQNMEYCGRMYLNPSNRSQIWINIGWNTKGSQRYPVYHPGLSAYFSNDCFNEIIYEAQKEFENVPFDGVGMGLIAMGACLFSCGICFCPCVYLCCKVKAFGRRVNHTMESVGLRYSLRVQYRLVESAATGGYQWLDSNGKPISIGPPLGCNIIITLPAKIPTTRWPPRAAIPMQPVVAPQTQTAYAPPIQTANALPAYTANWPQKNTAGAPPMDTASAPPTHTASAPMGYEDVAPPAYEESAAHPPAYS